MLEAGNSRVRPEMNNTTVNVERLPNIIFSSKCLLLKPPVLLRMEKTVALS